MSAARRTRLDLNQAELAELAAVPGLDAELAERIIALRPFGKLKELLRVAGLEMERYELAAPHLRVVIARDTIRPPGTAAPTRRRTRSASAQPPAEAPAPETNPAASASQPPTAAEPAALASVPPASARGAPHPSAPETSPASQPIALAEAHAPGLDPSPIEPAPQPLAAAELNAPAEAPAPETNPASQPPAAAEPIALASVPPASARGAPHPSAPETSPASQPIALAEAPAPGLDPNPIEPAPQPPMIAEPTALAEASAPGADTSPIEAAPAFVLLADQPQQPEPPTLADDTPKLQEFVRTAEPAPPTLELIATAQPERGLILSPWKVASEVLFESYLGPRLMFTVLSVTLLALVVGLTTGQLRLSAATRTAIAFNSPTAAAAAPVSPTAGFTPSPQASATFTASPTASPTPPASPTASPIPSATETVVFVSNNALSQLGAQIFNETFVPPGYWNTGENDFSNIYIAKGYLTIRMKTPGTIAWVVNGFSGQDFYYQGTARAGACRAGDYYGLLFRAHTEANLYMFGISCEGKYRVLRRELGEFHTLIDFTFAPEINAGSNVTNLLAVRAVGSTLSLYVNDQLLTTLEGAGIDNGLFGTFAKSYETTDLQIDFDDLSAWEVTP